MDTEPTRLPLQSFLALAAIGWSDGALQRVEREGLVHAAKECGLAGDELAQIESATTVRQSLDGVDLSGLSRWQQVVTYALASWFAALDGVVSTSEHETMVLIGDQLQLEKPLRVRAAAAANDIACLPGGGKPDRYDFVKLTARLRERLPQLANEA
jgi:hypothetical protein